MNAKVLFTDGKEKEITPANGTDFKLEELQEYIDGYIEIIYLKNNSILIIDEEGKLKDLPVNKAATVIFIESAGAVDYIVGNTIYCDNSMIK